MMMRSFFDLLAQPFCSICVYRLRVEELKPKRRQFTPEERHRVVTMVEEGKPVSHVADFIGARPSTVFRWIVLFNYHGVDGLQDRPRSGRPRLIDARKAQWIYRAVCGGDPRQQDLPFMKWSLAIIKALVKKKFGIDVSRSTISRLLARLGVSPQKPIRKSFKRDKGKIWYFLNRKYPRIFKRAKDEEAEIFFLDESGACPISYRGHTWGAVGKTPVVYDSGDRYRVNMVSAISASGEMCFDVYDGRMNSQSFCSFLEKLQVHAGKSICVISDNAHFHKSKAVMEYVKGLGTIRLEYLPPYTPEMNPDEQVWNHLKRRLSQRVAESKQDLVQMVNEILVSIQSSKELVQSFFKLKDTKYALGVR